MKIEFESENTRTDKGSLYELLISKHQVHLTRHAIHIDRLNGLERGNPKRSLFTQIHDLEHVQCFLLARASSRMPYSGKRILHTLFHGGSQGRRE